MSSKLRQTHIVSITYYTSDTKNNNILNDKKSLAVMGKYCITRDVVDGILIGGYLIYGDNLYKWLSICYEGFSIDVVDEGKILQKEYCILKNINKIKLNKVITKDMYRGILTSSVWFKNMLSIE